MFEVLNQVIYVLGIATIVVFIIPKITDRYTSNETKIDIKKWYLNDQTGEYHRIRYKDKSGYIIDNDTYEQRRLIYLQKRANSVYGKYYLLCIYIATIGIYLLSVYISNLWGNGHPQPWMFFSLLILWPMFGCAVICFIVAIFFQISMEINLLHAIERDVGPSPVQIKSDDFGPAKPTESLVNVKQDEIIYRPKF